MCDTFIALNNSTLAGDIIFAKNSDRQYNEAQYIEMLPARLYQSVEKLRLTHIEIDQVSHTYTVLLSKPHWIWGAEIGANEHGLVIGNEAVFSKVPGSNHDGIIGMDLLRLALERARNVDEAIEVITTLLAQFGQGGNCGYQQPITYDNSFIIADGLGAKVLETAGREWAVQRLEDYYSISNTMTIGTDFCASSRSLEEVAEHHGFCDSKQSMNFKSAFEDRSSLSSGEQRRARSMALLGSRVGEIEITDAFKILRDHGGSAAQGEQAGPGICMHKDMHTKKDAIGQTTGSMVSSLHDNKRVHWITGTARACTSVFKPIILEAGIPEHGPKPGADEEELVSLWWRHERLSRVLLDRSNSIIDADSYACERDALEQGFIKLMKECPAPTSSQHIQACRDTVTSCWRKALEFEDKWYGLGT